MAAADNLGGQFVGASPVPEVSNAAARYRQSNDLQAPEQDYARSVIPLSRSQEISRNYMAMPVHDPAAMPAYHAMGEEVGRQFDHMTSPRSKGGLGIDVSVADKDPYGGFESSPDNIISDLRNARSTSTGKTPRSRSTPRCSAHWPGRRWRRRRAGRTPRFARPEASRSRRSVSYRRNSAPLGTCRQRNSARWTQPSSGPAPRTGSTALTRRRTSERTGTRDYRVDPDLG